MPDASKDCIECQLVFPAPLDAMQTNNSGRMAIWLHEYTPLGVVRDEIACCQFDRIQLSNTLVSPFLGVVKSCLQHFDLKESETDYVVRNVKAGLDQAVAVDFAKRAKAKNKIMRSGGMTMMICNIPCRVSQTDLTDAIISLGFGTFEFVHLPCRLGSYSNLGYGFVHFPCQVDAERFALAFEGHRFSQRGKLSEKTCTVKVADQQGHDASHKVIARKLRLAQSKSST